MKKGWGTPASGSGFSIHGERHATRNRIAGILDRYATGIYSTLLVLFLIVALATIQYMTLDVDEAWILLSTAHAVGIKVPVTAAFGRPTITTGGVHLLIHGTLDCLTMNIFVHRMASLLAAGCLLIIVYYGLRKQRHRPRVALAGAAMCAAAPGFLNLAGVAMGEMIAGFLLVAVALHWANRGRLQWRAAVGTGLWLGAACATRINCLAAIPGLLLFAMLDPGLRGQVVARAALTSAVAIGITVIAAGGYYIAGHAQTHTGNEYLGAATGLSLQQPFARAILSARIANEYLPFTLIAGIVGCWAIRRSRTADIEATAANADWAGTLLFLALPMLAAWLFVAPIPHLRYLWPALICIWLVGVILLCDLADLSLGDAADFTFHGVVLVASGYSLVAASLAIVTGESLVIDYQEMGVAPRLAPKPSQWFMAESDQRKLAGFMAQRSPYASFFTSMLPTGYPLTYLSGRSVGALAALPPNGERYVLMLPSDYTIWRPEPLFVEWLRKYGRVVFRSGNYAAFNVTTNAPPPPTRRSSVGQNDLF